MATAGFAGSFNFLDFSGSGDAGANSIYLTKVTLFRSATIAAVIINVPSLATGKQIKALIYNSTPSALLATGSIVASLAAGHNRLPLTASVVLSAGTYYVGYVCNLTLPVTTAALAASSWFVGGGQSVTTPANPLVGGASSGNGLEIVLEFDGTTAQAYGWGADYSSGGSLSVSNTVGTVPAAGASSWASLRSVVTQSTPGGGKYYAEIVPSAVAATDTYIGMATASVNLGNVGVATNSARYTLLMRGDGAITGTASAGGVSYTAGDVIGIAFDAGAGLSWFNKNNGAWFGQGAGNPATGTLGLATAIGNWPMMLFAARINAAGSFTIYDYPAALHYALPAGFSAWAAGPAAAPSSQSVRVMVLA